MLYVFNGVVIEGAGMQHPLSLKAAGKSAKYQFLSANLEFLVSSLI